MRAITIIKAVDVGNDVLQVTGEVDGEQVQATGWVSAMTNHFDSEAYGADGHRTEKAKPREMSKEEKRAYCESLLDAAVPKPAPAEVPIDIGI